MSFFTELKRRNVFKVGIAYLIAAWILLQLLSILLPAFDAPAWVIRVFFLLLSVGLMVSLFVAWAFELTPEGMKPTGEVSPQDSITKNTGQKLKNFAIVGLVLALGLVVLDSYILSEDPEDSNQEALALSSTDSTETNINEANNVANIELLEKSIAVLPFVDLSQAGDQEYFSDGLSEEILNKLAQVQDLQVAARTSSFSFKGQNDDMRIIGDQLGVNYILEGSVRKSGNQLRITAQLIQVDNGFHLWSENFDRQLEDIFALQDEIALSVTTALRVTLGTDEFALPGSTRNVEAYQHYLRGVAFSNLGGTNDEEIFWQDTVDEFLQAVTLDPDYARAWLWLNGAYRTQAFFLSQDRQEELLAKQVQALQMANLLAPEMAELQFNQAIEKFGEGDLAEAERLILEVLQTSKSARAESIELYTQFLMTVGRVNEALPYAEQTVRLDPLSSQSQFTLALIFIAQDRLDEAEQVMKRALESSSEGRGGYLPTIGWMIAYEKNGREGWAARVLAEIDPGSTFDNDMWNLTAANILAEEDTEIAMEKIREIAADPNMSRGFLTSLSDYSNILGDHEQALEYLNEFGTSSPWPSFNSEMRKLDGFKQWVAEQGFVNYWRTTDNWPDSCRPLPDTETDFECF